MLFMGTLMTVIMVILVSIFRHPLLLKERNMGRLVPKKLGDAEMSPISVPGTERIYPNKIKPLRRKGYRERPLLVEMTQRRMSHFFSTSYPWISFGYDKRKMVKGAPVAAKAPPPNGGSHTLDEGVFLTSSIASALNLDYSDFQTRFKTPVASEGHFNSSLPIHLQSLEASLQDAARLGRLRILSSKGVSWSSGTFASQGAFVEEVSDSEGSCAVRASISKACEMVSWGFQGHAKHRITHIFARTRGSHVFRINQYTVTSIFAQPGGAVSIGFPKIEFDGYEVVMLRKT